MLDEAKDAASTSRRSPTRPPSGNGQSEVKTPRPASAPPRTNDTLHIPKPRHHRPPNIQLLDPENAPQLWQRSPTRQSTEDIELQDRSNSRGPKESKEPKERPGSRFSSSSRGPSPVKAPADKDSVLDVPSWRGDIATFTDAVIAHPESRNYKVYKIQARKSRKLPFKHEFLLVYVHVAGKPKVVRIDRLGKIGGILGLRQGHRAALEEVHIFDLEHPDAEDWLYDTKRNGSQPIATLMASPPPGSEQLPNYPGTSSSSQNTVTIVVEGAPWPTLSLVDIARMFKFIQVEMPTYVLTTKNCFMMTRSILMILCTCFGDGYFTCYLEDENSDKNRILAKELVEPLYNGIVRWYFPVVLSVLLTYMLVMFLIHWIVEVHLTGHKTDPGCDRSQTELNACDLTRGASQYGGVSFMHMLLDLPIPCAVIHWWLTKMEKEIKSVCLRLRKRIEKISLGTSDIFQDSALDSAPLEESESSKHSFKPYLVLLVLTVGGSIVLGVYWDKGLMVAVALCIIFLLMCALQGDGISADMESYVRLDNDEGDLNV
ncbi:transmembrane protein [Ceratobasidium sp. AG-Ba]|nr:transmembrane protein [Ceratobasidium sp. AG-Ba]